MSSRPRPNWARLRAALWERCGGLCEITGVPLDPDTFDAHHRRPKGMGGTVRADTDTLPNLLAVTPTIHNGQPHSVHQDPGWSRPLGYLVGKHVEHVFAVPVKLREQRWVLLTPEGGYWDC